MSFGFEVTNNNNHVLVSSEAKTLHFLGKAQYVGVIYQVDEVRYDTGQGWIQYWVPASGYTPGHYDWQYVPYTGWGNGTTIHRFQIQCSAIPVPFFSQPGWEYMGIIGVTNVGGNTWYIDIAQSGGIAAAIQPEVYVFCEASAIPVASGETHGLQVIASDGSIAFDSRFKPLRVVTGVVCTPPADPVGRPLEASVEIGIGSAATGFSEEMVRVAMTTKAGEFGTWDSFNEVLYPDELNAQKPIYNYYSIANSEREITQYASWSWERSTGWARIKKKTYYEQVWVWFWSFYRSGISNTGTGVAAGWIITDHGYRYHRQQDQSNTIIGIHYDSSQSTGAGGGWPFSNTAANLGGQFVMVADGKDYD